MLRTVKFYHNICFRAVEINNIAVNYFLAIYRNRQFFQEVIPKMLFFFRHITPQGLGVFC